MGTVFGNERPVGARKGKFDYAGMMVNVGGFPQTTIRVAVDYTAVAANQTYTDMYTSTVNVVCGGTPKLFACGLGILKDDFADGTTGSYVLHGEFRLPIKDSDTPAVGALLYWDDTNKYLTTTASGNSKAAVSLEPYADWQTGSNTDHNGRPAISGRKWGIVLLKPSL